MKPQLFIIGAPKTGTTALCSYLAAHPEICFSDPKEPKFFHTDFSTAHRLAMSEDEYLRCFHFDPSRHLLLAEGTVWYLFSKEAVSNILAYNPEACFVVMIRDPVKLAHSLHSQLVYGGDEDELDFKKAWRLQSERRAGRKIPTGARDPKALLYGDVAKLGEQIQRLFSVVARDRILIINNDDFAQNPKREYSRVLDFVKLRNDDRENFERLNENKQLLRSPLTSLAFLLRRVKLGLGLKHSFGIWAAIQPLVAKRARRVPLDSEFELELYEYFRADVELMERLLDVDLSPWKRPPPVNFDPMPIPVSGP